MTPSFAPSTRRLPGALAAIGLLALALAGIGMMTAGPARAAASAASDIPKPVRTFSVKHGPAAPQMITAGSSGHRLGDLRVLPATPIMDGTGAIVGRLDAELLTTSVDSPHPGDEVRMSTLNFVFGEGNSNLAGSADQLIVSGSGYYPGSSSTIAVGNGLIRPITGGSGIHAGASGWCKTEHLADNSWEHTFYLLPTPRR